MQIKLETITKENFKPFGDLIEFEGTPWFHINQGKTERYHGLSIAQANGTDAKVVISLARGDAYSLPLHIEMLERHPFGSQAWIPVNNVPFIAVVAPNGNDDRPDLSKIRAFWVHGNQGVNYAQGTWHHPLMSIDAIGDFIIVDREGVEKNCDEVFFDQEYLVDKS